MPVNRRKFVWSILLQDNELYVYLNGGLHTILDIEKDDFKKKLNELLHEISYHMINRRIRTEVRNQELFWKLFDDEYVTFLSNRVTCSVCGETYGETDVNMVDYVDDICIHCEKKFIEKGMQINILR